jgi:hypothetical protein
MAEAERNGRRFGNGWRIAGWGLATLPLILPATAMIFTAEVNWTASDFLIMGLMIGCVGLGIELAVRATRNSMYRGGAGLALLTGFLVTWTNGAVGIIGDEDHPANLMFFGVIAIAVAGAFMARFKAPGMVRTMAVAALGQFAVPLIAIAIWSPPITVDLVRTLLFNSVFASFWLISAWLFREASESAEHYINVN